MMRGRATYTALAVALLASPATAQRDPGSSPAEVQANTGAADKAPGLQPTTTTTDVVVPVGPSTAVETVSANNSVTPNGRGAVAQGPRPDRDISLVDGYAPDSTSQPFDASFPQGAWYSFQNLVLLAAALMMGLLGGLLSRLIPRGRKRQIRQANELERRIDDRLRSFETRLHTRFSETESALFDVRRELAALSRQSISSDAVRPAARSAPPPTLDEEGTSLADQAPPSAEPDLVETPRSTRSNSLVEAYSIFLSGASKRRAFDRLVEEFGPPLGLSGGGDGQVSAKPFSGNDPNELLVAFGDDNEWLVAPSHEYATQFSTVFTEVVQNPTLIRNYFDLTADGTGQLGVDLPATIRQDPDGYIQLITRGRLSGFKR